jgi:hypothetical protein
VLFARKLARLPTVGLSAFQLLLVQREVEKPPGEA